MTSVLVAGESWTTVSTHVKGFDSFTTVEYNEGGGALLEALDRAGHQVTFLPNHMASREFPATVDELDRFDVVLLSDIGANTLLIAPETFSKTQRRPNRLQALRDWTLAGGGLGMVGGYLSFQGIGAKANYRNTVLASVLPVEMEPGDDRDERPEGVTPRVTERHSITDGLPEEWPALLGFQRLIPRAGSLVLASVDGSPLLVIGEAGGGRSLAFASDIGPHWAPPAFTEWPGFATLWDRTVRWLGQEETGSRGRTTTEWATSRSTRKPRA